MIRKSSSWLGLVMLLAASLVACSGEPLKPHIPKRCDQIVDDYFLTIPYHHRTNAQGGSVTSRCEAPVAFYNVAMTN